jgi:hypothetical protein
MIALTYLSTATRPFSTDDLTGLMAHARPKNEAHGITGMLLHAGGSFIQTIEGAADDVDALFGQIEADPRHRDVMVTLREDVAGRSFPDWSMGFEHLTPAQVAQVEGLNGFLQAAGSVRGASLEFSRAGVFHRVFSDFAR